VLTRSDRENGGFGGTTLLAGLRHSAAASTFEAAIGPGFDVGAHRHVTVEELFYVLEGSVYLLCFEPRDLTNPNWRQWESADGARVVRAGPGAFMFVPPGCPHAFANPGPGVARLLFQTIPAGHEEYLAALRNRGAETVEQVRLRYGIEQLTPIGAFR
jgi:oxalate decarboxylase/phosphoglucose isomerase-like protein (cupin superfamily)